MLKKLLAGVTTLALALGMVAVTAGTVSATGTECVPKDAYTETITPATDGSPAVYRTVVVSEAGWQRHNYTKTWESNEAPVFPGDNWVPNVAGDPQKIGVAGAYSVSNANSGNVDWFYLEAIPAVTDQVLVTPAVLPTEAVTLEHPAVTCLLVQPDPIVTHSPVSTRDCEAKMVTTVDTISTTPFVLNESGTEYIEGTPVITTPTSTRDMNSAEAAECPVVVDPPVQPKSIVTQSPVSTRDCEAKTVTTVDTISTTTFVLNESETEYVKGTPVITTATSTREMTDAEAPECGQLTPLAFTGSNGTLAFTGSNGTLAGGLLLGLVFVLFGAGVITVTRVTRRNS
jgi:hypothetical protein